MKLTQEKYDLIKNRIIELMKSNSKFSKIPSSLSKLTDEQFESITLKLNKIVKNSEDNKIYDEEIY